MRELIASLEEKLAEQKYLLAVLKMWEDLKDQGVLPEMVARLGFSTKFCTPRERWGKYYKPPRCPWFNYYVCSKTGERIKLEKNVEAVYRD